MLLAAGSNQTRGGRLSRRALLAAPAVLARGADPGIRRELFLAAPGKGTAVLATAYYTKPKGVEMKSIEQRWSRSDTIDVAYIRHSKDNGKTWTAPEELRTGEKRPEGMWRRHPRAGFVDRGTGRYVEFWVEGVLPTDDPLEGMRQWNLFYSVNGGPAKQIIHKGAEYNARHGLPGIYTGKNCVMLGDMPCVAVTARDGSILLPAIVTPVDADGKLYNPTGGYTYTDAAVLLGRWKGSELEWEMPEVVKGDPARATRGMDEPTLAFLTDGRVLMVLRGSNDKRYDLPSYRWVSYSSDGGRHWTKPTPWTYEDGSPFFSPSACSQLVEHSSGRLFWFGNITPENARGNRPRYPFVMGEVDKRSGLLKKASVRIVDTLQPGEDPIMSLSNFYAREDRQTRELVVHMTRLFAKPKEWVGDSNLYRVRV
jgi:hypothetical protein